MNEEVKSNNVRKAAAEIIQGIAPALNDDPPSQITVQRIIDRHCHVSEMEAVVEKAREALLKSKGELEFQIEEMSDSVSYSHTNEVLEEVQSALAAIEVLKGGGSE